MKLSRQNLDVVYDVVRFVLCLAANYAEQRIRKYVYTAAVTENARGFFVSTSGSNSYSGHLVSISTTNQTAYENILNLYKALKK